MYKSMKVVSTVAVGGVAVGTSLSAAAQSAPAAPDVTVAVAQIMSDLGPIGQIGLAVLTVVIGIAVWKFLRRTA